MTFLATDLRRKLETTVKAARRESETGAANLLASVGYAERESPAGLSEPLKALRRNLRARGRQLGEGLRTEDDARTAHEIGRRPVMEEIAYEQWHRMLFARFLADNDLLRHPSGAPVTLGDCEDLYAEEGALDAWDLAARYASAMLPGLFRESSLGNSNSVPRITLAPETRVRLEGLIDRLPIDVFTSEDGLGWVYQFWQSERKKQVNDEAKSKGTKIGAAELPAVTQLFTEEYMVRFLLENTLGAWWAGKYPDSPLLEDMRYLRYAEASDGTVPSPPRRPAAGTFDGWAKTVAELRVLDPCCGSGHFLTVAFDMLRRMRMEEEELDEGEAADAVLRDNLFGLELDRRCTQIAVFNVALAAWRVGGHPERYVPQIACSGTPVRGQLVEWQRVADGDDALEFYVEKLYQAFAQAPILGSLIDPRSLLYETGLAHREQTVMAGLRDAPAMTTMDLKLFRRTPQQSSSVLTKLAHRFGSDPDLAIFADSAEQVAQAADILSGRYDLTVTNVPYLSRESQHETLRDYADQRHKSARSDLATITLERCLGFGEIGGTVAAVSPQNWLFLDDYRHFRENLLVSHSLNIVVDLGPAAFDVMNWWAIRTTLVGITSSPPSSSTTFLGINASDGKGTVTKTFNVMKQPVLTVSQAVQKDNPNCQIAFKAIAGSGLLEEYGQCLAGITSGDYGRYGRLFWEIDETRATWRRQQSTVRSTVRYGGREHLVQWLIDDHTLVEAPGATVRGRRGWDKRGVAISQMGDLPVTLYTGELVDDNTAVLVPNDPANLPAIWAYCSSDSYASAVRVLDTRTKVWNKTLAKVPFDLEYWQEVAERQYPGGLPEPHSDDPTQWLFKGQPKDSEAPLQVAIARLLGYRWPEQPVGESDPLDALADLDGIVCLPAVVGEQPAHVRLRAMLATSWGDEWSQGVLNGLLTTAGAQGNDLAVWLAEDFFRQHCRLFHNRPFIWHIWDGRKDGFSALVNYHRLDAARLSKLTYTYLNEWIGRQRAEAERNVAGAQLRLDAALGLQRRLELIIDGAPPYDIYVRWKPLHRQPIGWQPDLNDGVRLNVRPFVQAEVLRSKFSVNWNKDRGANPVRADVYAWSEAAQAATVGDTKPETVDGALRLNDLHIPLEVKRQAREAAKGELASTTSKKT